MCDSPLERGGGVCFFRYNAHTHLPAHKSSRPLSRGDLIAGADLTGTSKKPIKTLNRATKSQNRIVNLQHI
jgi:hypothetical protein